MEIARWAKIPKKKGRDQSTQKNHENLQDLRNLHWDSREPSKNQRDPRPRRGSEVLRTSERSKRLRKDWEPLVRKNHRENWEIDSHWQRDEIEKREPLAVQGDPKGTDGCGWRQWEVADREREKKMGTRKRERGEGENIPRAETEGEEECRGKWERMVFWELWKK